MISYLFQTVLISSILTTAYFFLFRKSKQFQIRRALVLAIPLFSLLIPFANYIRIDNNPVKENGLFNQVLEVVRIASSQSQDSRFMISADNILFGIYSSIAFILLLVMAYRIISVLRLRDEAEYEEGFYVVNNEYQAFSFFSLIFIPSAQLNNTELIIEHEKVHVNQFHSIDIIYFEILKAALWFNPIIYLLRKELSAIHEFTADQVVIEKQIDVEQYYKVLFENVLNEKLTISNNFNNSLTKYRFIMMTKTKIKERLSIRLFGMLLILSSMIVVFQACDKGVNTKNKKDNMVVGDEFHKAVPKEALKVDDAQKVDVYPSYPGGDKERIAFISENTKYPESALEDSIQGMVYVNFIVSKDGSLKELRVLRGVSPEVDAEALRVVSIMPKWSPAEKDGEKVDFEFTIPFKFALN
jgi:TonB family protein